MRELEPGVALGIPDLLKLVFVGMASGLVVALIEETFLRGAMQTAITRESGAALAIGADLRGLRGIAFRRRQIPRGAEPTSTSAAASTCSEKS